MSTTPAVPAPRAGSPAKLRLSGLLRRPITDRGGESIGRLSDVIVRLRGADDPVVTGLVATVGGRAVFVPIDQVASLGTGEPGGPATADGGLRLTSAKLDLRRFERRDGEVLLRADVLGHRLIDVESAHLIRAGDLELAWRAGGWVVSGVDSHRRPRRLPWTPAAGGDEREHGVPGVGPVRAADRPHRQRAAARPVRAHPQAQAGPDRRPAGRRVQGRGDRDTRPGARRP